MTFTRPCPVSVADIPLTDGQRQAFMTWLSEQVIAGHVSKRKLKEICAALKERFCCWADSLD